MRQESPPNSSQKPKNGSKVKAPRAAVEGDREVAALEDRKVAPLKARPLDVSNGKALYKKYDNIEYNSITQGAWLEVQVIMVREDGAIMIDLKDRYWFDLQEQSGKFREGGRKPWLVESELQYYSQTQGGWVDCTVVNRNMADNTIQISCKEHYWMSVAEQDEKLRMPLYDRSDEVVWEAGKMLKQDPADCKGSEQKLRQLLQDEPDHTLAMESLANLLRDWHLDFGGAEVLYRRALNENPFEIKVLSDFGDLLKVLGKKPEAEEIHQRWRKVRDKMKEIEDELGV